MSQGSSKSDKFAIPERPWLFESGMIRLQGEDIEHIAAFAHDEWLEWLEWSLETEDVLRRMGDRLMRIEVPDDDMMFLIQKASNHPVKPSIPVLQKSDSDSARAAKIREMACLETNWDIYAREIEKLHAEIAKVLELYDNEPPPRAAQRVEEILNMADLSISRGPLRMEDLRNVFFNMLKHARELGIETQRQRNMIREAEAMTDAESEAYVDSLEKLSIKQD